MKNVFKYLLFAFVCVMTLTATASVITVLTMKKDDNGAQETVEVANENLETASISGDEESKTPEVVDPQPVVENKEKIEIASSELTEITSDYFKSVNFNKASVKKVYIKVDSIVIKSNAFADFTGLEKLYVNASNVTIEEDAFVNSDKLSRIYIDPSTIIKAGAFSKEKGAYIATVTYTSSNKTDELIVVSETIDNLNLGDREGITEQVLFDNSRSNIKIYQSDLDKFTNKGYSISSFKDKADYVLAEPVVIVEE